MHASTIFVAIFAALSVSVSARPVFARDGDAFGVDVNCLGFNYLFGGPHHTPNKVSAREPSEDDAEFEDDSAIEDPVDDVEDLE
ncbi:hypothetical protein MIND_00879800 [Mycena indigotica]|uniref:Uncharacterized protein n=1 Tax=Mycena indigotica TaxID=2126181 RepID=A0A8H6SGU4_9AGAR|nr:uncharacterized protein MIND_00879800 [Mycena indigotica]KAF7299308.1 hypothetical protein MIND_00879800 [Mycena indigotica]